MKIHVFRKKKREKEGERERERERERSCHKFHFLPWNAAYHSPLHHSIPTAMFKSTSNHDSLYPRNFLINHFENSRRKRFCIRALNIRRKTLLSKFAAVAYSEENATNASNYKTPRAFLNRSVRIVARHWLRAALCYLSLFLRSSSDGMSGGE